MTSHESTPPPIDPDTKDWTWVLETKCPECGFEAGSVRREEVASMLRSNASRWQQTLDGDHASLRTRPRPGTWSPLEYAAHVRDVFRIYDERLRLMLTEDGARYANWDQDASAIDDRYHEADPAAVASALVEHATRLADRFDTVEGDQWDRTGYRSDGAAFTVESFARYFIHDPIHHLHDIGG